MIILQITSKLYFTAFIVFLTMPYFQLNNIAFTAIIHDHICALLFPGLSFNIIIANTINNGTQVK